MKFIYSSPETAVAEIAAAVNVALEKGPVLWLVSGGSNIQLAADVRAKLKINNSLTVGLIDERYGSVGHPDSNWTQLMAAGFDTRNIQLLPVMHDQRSLDEACTDYEQRLLSAIQESARVIGIFGIGDDGHTSGILPDSPAVGSAGILESFVGPDFPRITTTPATMKLIDEAYLVSFGQTKHSQLRRLNEQLPVNEHPVQCLKQTQNLIVYSDLAPEAEA